MSSSVVMSDLGWTPAQRLGFRAGFLYLVLYLLPFPLPIAAYGDAWDALAVWVGHHLLGITREIPTEMTGSGDRTVDYLRLFCQAIAAGGGALLWSALDRRPHHRELAAHLRVYLRYALAMILLIYGLAKVLKSQMPAPGPSTMLEPLGDHSPMGLLWTTLGHSTPYTVFTGACEVLAGVLLFARRTTSLGALVSIGVMSNVVMLNLSYDVPVKLYSLHLLAIALVLLAPDARRLWRAVVSIELAPRPRRVRIAKAVAITVMCALVSVQAWSVWTEWGDRAPRHPLHGAYEADAGPWAEVAIERGLWIGFDDEGRRSTYRLRYDPAGESLLIERSGASHPVRLERLADGGLRLTGTFRGEPLDTVLRPRTFLLETRGFHWINERPFVR